MYMNEQASAFYLSRTLPFMSVLAIANKLGVTRPTVERMIDNCRIPLKYRDGFESVLDGLSEEFRKKAKRMPKPNYYEVLEKAMLDLEPKNIAARDEHGNGDEDFIEEIEPLLRRRKGVSSREVMDIAAKHKVTRQKMYRLTDRMNVRRDIIGKGRAMQSTWYLD